MVILFSWGGKWWHWSLQAISVFFDNQVMARFSINDGATWGPASQRQPKWKIPGLTPPKFNSTAHPWKLMIGRFCFLLGLPIFRGYIKFPGCCSCSFRCFFLFGSGGWGEVQKRRFLTGALLLREEPVFGWKVLENMVFSTVLVRLLELCMVGRESWW